MLSNFQSNSRAVSHVGDLRAKLANNLIRSIADGSQRIPIRRFDCAEWWINTQEIPRLKRFTFALKLPQ